jgi:hypothetical protein
MIDLQLTDLTSFEPCYQLGAQYIIR